jgi:hypothetical protein
VLACVPPSNSSLVISSTEQKSRVSVRALSFPTLSEQGQRIIVQLKENFDNRTRWRENI